LAKAKNTSETQGTTAANVGYEARLWQMADALRGSMDAAEYKHVCLGLLFLKYISDAFEERHEYLERAVSDPKDEYYLPPSTRNRSAPGCSRIPTSTAPRASSGCRPRRAGPT
jgi:type I restriction-modification system DNA methylase subunit